MDTIFRVKVGGGDIKWCCGGTHDQCCVYSTIKSQLLGQYLSDFFLASFFGITWSANPFDGRATEQANFLSMMQLDLLSGRCYQIR